MTTEIAVLNRLGVALATDSAVTISSDGHTKVFDTADKLFELSSHCPVAAMINGNMDCLGVPWEILVKDFRRERGNTHRATIGDWMRDFLDFVEKNKALSDVVSGRQIRFIVSAEAGKLQKSFDEAFRSFYFSRKGSKTKKIAPGIYRSTLTKIIKDEIQRFEDINVAESLKDITVEQIISEYGEIIDEQLKRRFRPYGVFDDGDEEKDLLRRLMALMLLSSEQSDFATGIVIAGYGEHDTFPTVQSVEVDGRMLGKLKFSPTNNHPINDGSDRGRVVSFAQTDVIERLLGGADREFVVKTSEFIEQAVIKMADAIEAAIRPTQRPDKKRQLLASQLAAEAAIEYRDKTAKELRESFARNFDRMIAMMPKQELIELAEALVSITVAERRASHDAGTVGGPIDVAIITRHEGFVWIKRKHYFNKDLNPRFFWRMYGLTTAQGS